MRTERTSESRTFTNVCEFAALYPAVYPRDSYGHTLIRDLKVVAEEMERLMASQASGIASARDSSIARMDAREDLIAALSAVAGSARGIAVNNPEIGANKFRVPYKASDKKLISTARSFAADAAPLVDLFVKFGMSPTFIEDLTSKVKTFQTASFKYSEAQKGHKAITSAIDEVAEKGRAILLQLDPITKNNLQGNAFLLGQWEQARQILRTSRTTKAPKAAAKNGATKEAEETTKT